MKKWLSVLLSLLLIGTMLPVSAMPVTAATADEPTIVVSDATAIAGDTITVTVSMKNNPGIVSTKVKVGYDADVLTLVGHTAGEFYGGGYSFSTYKNPFVINWCHAAGRNDTAEWLATLTFQVADDAVPGDYPLTLTYDNQVLMYLL